MSWRNGLLLLGFVLVMVVSYGCDEESGDPPGPSYQCNIFTYEAYSNPVINVSIEISHTDEAVGLTVNGNEATIQSTDEYFSAGEVTVPYDTLLALEVLYGDTTFYDTLHLRENPHITYLKCNNVYLMPNNSVTVPYSEYSTLEWDNGYPLELPEISEENYDSWHLLTLYWSTSEKNSTVSLQNNFVVTEAVSNKVVTASFARDLGYSLSSSIPTGLPGRTSIRRVVAFRSISFPYQFIGNGL